jgi:CDP-6-deoxy-D-xylo-4-hexulose-3-dehydrase
MPEPYRLAADTFGRDEIDAAKAVLDSGLLTLGERVRSFERDFASWIGARHAVMVNSGSSANLLAIDTLLRRSRGASPVLAPGDEVLVPALSWPTTVWPIVQLGLVPVFVDVDPATLAIDLESARDAIGPRTRAMFLIHVLGRAADLTAVERFCAAQGLRLLEDACESLGAWSAGRHVGTVGAAGTFSFYFSHHLSTIEGGMIVTDDPALHDDLVGLRAHGWIRDRGDRASWSEVAPELDPRFFFATLGYNVRPMELQGAIGAVQLRRLDAMLEEREALARRVASCIARAPWLELLGAETLGESPVRSRRQRVHSWMTLPFRVRDGSPVGRDVVVRHLEAHGVETRPIIAGNLARHPAARTFASRSARSLATCDDLLARGFMAGCHPGAAPGALATLERALTSLGDLG